MFENIIYNPLFSIVLILASYLFGSWCQRKSGKGWVNPLLISIILIVAILRIFDIPLEAFNIGGNIVAMFLAPATALLAVSIYKEWKNLKKNFLPIVIGSLVGSFVSVFSIIILCQVLGVETNIKLSLISKSVTTPIAIAITENLGGVQGITVCAVIITGLLGNILAPSLVKILHINDATAQGIAIGTASHAFGTSKAIEMGDGVGAMSGIALSLSGIITVVISLFL